MAGRCTVCAHPERPAIEQAMLNHRPFRQMAGQFGLGKDALLRHHDVHLPETLVKAHGAAEVARADDLLAELVTLKAQTHELLADARSARDFKGYAALVREIRGCIDLMAEMMKAIDRRPTVNVLLAPEWLAVRGALLNALMSFPEARTAVAAQLVALEAPA